MPQENATANNSNDSPKSCNFEELRLRSGPEFDMKYHILHDFITTLNLSKNPLISLKIFIN